MKERPQTHRGRGSKGFTLVELLVVLAVLALITALAVPRLAAPLAGVQFRTSADDLVAALRGARALARERGEPVAVLLDLRARRFGHQYADGTTRWLGGWDANLSLGVRTAAEEISPTQDRVRIPFFPDGSNLGAVVTLAHGEKRIIFTIDWLTGVVRRGQESG